MTSDERLILEKQISKRLNEFKAVGTGVSKASEWFRSSLAVLLEQMPPPKREGLLDTLASCAFTARTKAADGLLASLIFPGVNDKQAEFLGDFMTFESVAQAILEAQEDLATAPTKSKP